MVNKTQADTREVTAALHEATRGLLYQSETDEPFETVFWPGDGQPLEAPKVLQLAGEKPFLPVQADTLDSFFGDLIQDQEWFGAEEKATARRYRQLLEVLKTRLAGVRVFRIGEVNVSIYILGQTRLGDWAGVRTRAVET